jgi:putative peptidoglycan lipid II flippase
VPSSNRPSLGKTFSIVALLTVMSKVVGLLRDIVVAAAYGTSVLADAYNYAYLFTGNILILFGGLGGPFHSATVTTLEPRKDEPEAGALVIQVLLLTALLLSVVTVVMFLAAPYVMHLLAGHYGHDHLERIRFFNETVAQLRTMSPLILIAGVIGITYGVLNVFNKIFWPSLSPAIASLAIIIALILFPDKNSSMPLAIGTLIGAFGQLLAQAPQFFTCGLKYRFSLKAVKGLHSFFSMLWPVFIGTSIGQIIIYVDMCFCAGLGEGSWTAIINANRLVQLPLGVLITAMLVPVLPRFTAHASANRFDELKAEFRRSVSLLCFLAIPLTMILIVLPGPIIKLLFQRGAFDSNSTNLVTAALVYLVPSIAFYIGRDLITRVFYGLQDSLTPFRVAICAIFVKVLLDYLFVIVYHLGVGGISLATTFITIFNLTLLAFLLRKRIGRLGLTNLVKPLAIMTIASAIAGLAVYFSFAQLQQIWVPVTVFPLIIKIGVATALGGIVYFAGCSVVGLHEPKLLLERILKKSRSPS